jgi:hypothetical protein
MELLDDEAYDTLKDADVDLTEIRVSWNEAVRVQENIYGTYLKK